MHFRLSGFDILECNGAPLINLAFPTSSGSSSLCVCRSDAGPHSHSSCAFIVIYENKGPFNDNVADDQYV